MTPYGIYTILIDTEVAIHSTIFITGVSDGTRTRDSRIKSAILYQLSYEDKRIK